MTNSRDPKAPAATESIRTLLIQAGLSKSEAEAFLKRLRKEFISGSLSGEQKLRQFVDDHIAILLKDAHPARKSLAEKLRDAVFTAIVGLFIEKGGTALLDQVFKPALTDKQVTRPEILPEIWEEGEIMIEWWIRGTPSNHDDRTIGKLEPMLRRVLEVRETSYGLVEKRTAFSLDALGMCLDVQGRHREAVRLRSTALKIEEALYGPHDKRIAAAISNLGICFAAQGRYREAQKYLVRALKIAKKGYGNNSVPVGCIAANLCEILKVQGKLPVDLVRDRQFREAAKYMIGLKTVRVTMDGVKELLIQIQLLLPN
jgi:hypothetical protein